MQANSISVNVTFAGHGPNERIYGLGEHRTDAINMMPCDKITWQSQMYIYSRGSDVSIPWYMSSVGYGFIWNSAAYGEIRLNGDALTWTSYGQLNADFFITTTSAENTSYPYPELLRHYVDAVGHASKMSGRDWLHPVQTQLLEVAHGYVDRGLPISIIVID
jgi:alpha-D-xyloside xylohydrolase